MKRQYSIEYVDEDGESVIRHALMTAEEADFFVRTAAERGITVALHDLTPPQVDEAAAVSSGDEGPRLEKAPDGSVK